MKFLSLVFVLITVNLHSETLESIKINSDFNSNTFFVELSKKPQESISPEFSYDKKYNQQNIALRKIKLNDIQPDMDNSVILKLEKGDIDFYLKDLQKDGFKATAYTDSAGFYFIMVDLTDKDVASEAIGLAKYYYVKEVLVSEKTYNEIFNVKTVKSLKLMPVRIATITGGMNHSPVDMTINKLEWTIKGGINLSPIDLKINHENHTITGGANLSPVDLKFSWSKEEVTVEGGANRSPVKYTVNWENGILEGYSNNAPLKLNFDMKEGLAGENIVEIKGYANNSPVDLQFDKISGELKGGMNYSPVEIKLVNCDLYDFLQYIFIFLKPAY